MSVISPHLREMKFGQRSVVFSLRDGLVVAAPPDALGNDDRSHKIVLRRADGSVEVTNTQGWDIATEQGDVITQVYLAPKNSGPSELASVLNRTSRDRACVAPLGRLLRKGRISRGFIWWMSFLLLLSGAAITECGLYARQISNTLAPVDGFFSGPLQPIINLVSPGFDFITYWLLRPVSDWFGQASASFGNFQDHSLLTFTVITLMVLGLWLRSWRLILIPLFILSAFFLKMRLFGFESAQGAVLLWYAPFLVLLLVFGLISRLRDRWRLSRRLGTICKSQMTQPLPQNMIKQPPVTQPPAGEEKNEDGSDNKEPEQKPFATPTEEQTHGAPEEAGPPKAEPPAITDTSRDTSEQPA